MPISIRSDLSSILKLDDNTKSDTPKKLPNKVGNVKKRSSTQKSDKFKGSRNKSNNEIQPILDGANKGYKQALLRNSNTKTRRWHLVPFKTPGRSDSTRFIHWERVGEVLNSPFTKAYENELEIPRYTDEEYHEFLGDPDWTKEETDYLLDLCECYNLRFIVVVDRWDGEQHPSRSLEEIKERYYNIRNAFFKSRNSTGESSPFIYDREHEKKRRHQLNLLLSRTQEEEAEEEMLIHELKKIENRKRGYERKTQDLQKIIKAADIGVDIRKNDKKGIKRKPCNRSTNLTSVLSDNNLIRFIEIKGPAIYLSSQKIKLPNHMGNKMVKLIDDSLSQLKVEATLISSEERSTIFNELRQNIVLMHELKVTLSGCELEFGTLRHQYEASVAGKNSSTLLYDNLNECIQFPASDRQSNIINSPETTTPIKRKSSIEKGDSHKRTRRT